MMIPWQTLTKPALALGIVISLIILSSPIVPVQTTEAELTSRPLSYELTSSPRLLNKTVLFVFSKIVAQQSIKNTDNQTGTFDLNFIFDNGIEKDTATEEVDLLPGEEKVVYTDVPISGQVNVSVNVIPPKRYSVQKKVVQKNVSAWSALSGQY